ncbi:MAG TPA: GyrI-like domain-containing protein [Chitinophagaceae bacterium]|mgnify:CR=1 FL=1|nr:GyrI-like domain-containing protein [Chitinophagaceae bacterium]
MDIKTIPPARVLYFTTETTLAGLGSHIGKVAAELYKEAAAHELLPAGPVTWLYYGADGRPETTFVLEIALPVQGTSAGEPGFPVKTLPAFSCASAMHYGAWQNLPETYGKIIPALYQQGRKLSGVTREQYICIDFINPVNNITEVQVGL